MREQIVQLIDRLLAIRREAAVPGTSGLPKFLAASDIHGNVARLSQILAVAREQEFAHVYLVGDLYSGPGGWSLYRLLRNLVPDRDSTAHKLTLMWGNHEVALVAGMLGNDKQLRFFLSFGGEEIVRELNEDRASRGEPPVIVRRQTNRPFNEAELTWDTMPAPPRLTVADLARVREVPELLEMAKWIQQTHRLFAADIFGTGYLHAFPRINRHGQFTVQYQGQLGIEALPLIDADLRDAQRSDHPVFSTLLQTDTSPVWALFEITSARQFDMAVRSAGVRQIVFGHRHHTSAVNVSNCNRQIGIAVDFDRGRGGYLELSLAGLTFHHYVDVAGSRTEQTQLVCAVGNADPRQSHLRDIEEFLFGKLVAAEREYFDQLSSPSAQARLEFEQLEGLRQLGVPWIHRLYAEVYLHVKDPDLRKEMFSAAVASGDEDAFRSFIHLLHEKTRELESFGHDWYGEPYQLAKSVTQVVMTALSEMPVARLGLLDARLRGTTTRLNLTELYKRVLQLEDPDLALLAVQNLGMLRVPEALVALRRAFFHDVRKVRMRAAEVLASNGEIAYPLVAPILRSTDIWVRFLAMWTIAQLPNSDGVRLQAISDLRRSLQHESDWFLYTIGKELLRALDDADLDSLPDKPEIPNLTDSVIETLQQIVDSQQEPFRRALKVHFITVELSSLVYRRGLVGLDIDDLRIYVSNADYFPPYFRFYKSGDWDAQGQWRGWRRMWIRGETPNQPDGPAIISVTPGTADHVSQAGQTIVLYDHRTSNGKVQLPNLDGIIAQHGLGKVKDRVRHALLQQWESAFSVEEQVMLCRLHAAAMTKMLFDLPAELMVSESESKVLHDLAKKELSVDGQKSQHVVTLKADDGRTFSEPLLHSAFAHPLWLDVPKYAVKVRLKPSV